MSDTKRVRRAPVYAQMQKHILMNQVEMMIIIGSLPALAPEKIKERIVATMKYLDDHFDPNFDPDIHDAS